jgi:hypothetical protein
MNEAPRLKVKDVIAALTKAVETNPDRADYTVLWSNGAYVKFEVRDEGRWVMLGQL